LELSHITRRVGNRALVDGVSLRLLPGEVAALLGPSGAGKSTLLRLIAGLERPDSGTVTVGQEVLVGPGTWVMPEKRGVGLVFQDYALFPHMTVAANVAFGLRRLRPPARADRVAAELEAVGLAHRAGAFPHQLSGGEQQRVALARALAPDPRVILLDEPFAGLDPELRAEVRGLTLSRLRAARVPVLMVTHDAEEALALADRLVLLRAGRLVQAGPVGPVLAEPVDLGVARALGALHVLTIAEPGPWEPQLSQAGPLRLALRPDQVWLAEPDTGEGIDGQVVGSGFVGGRPTVQVALADGQVLPVAVHPAKSAPPFGSAVRLGFGREDLLWFAGDGPTAPRLSLPGRGSGRAVSGGS
jgi:iron(III) transport system ATP-binding protein